MIRSRSSLDRIKCNKSFAFFLIGQVISDLAEAFNFIAITSLLIQITSSGKSASFVVMCTPISSFIFSPIAGSLGDKFNEKYIISVINLLRGLTTLLFISNYNINTIYTFMLILASFEVLYNPSRKKMLLNLLGYRDIMIGNSLMLGMSGLVFIIGPVAAGLIIEVFKIKTIFLTTSILYCLATIILFSIENKSYKINKKMGLKPSLYKDFGDGYEYYKSQSSIRKLIFFSTLINLLIASVNTAFYPFAFDYLKVTSKEWGIMMSVFYGTNLLAMIISICLSKMINKMDTLFSYFTIIIVSAVWFFYSLANKLIIVIMLQFIEGLFVSLLSIALSTNLQLKTRRDYTARIIGINDIFNNIGKLISIIFTYFILRFKSPQVIFLLNFAIIFYYGIYKILSNE